MADLSADMAARTLASAQQEEVAALACLLQLLRSGSPQLQALVGSQPERESTPPNISQCIGLSPQAHSERTVEADLRYEQARNEHLSLEVTELMQQNEKLKQEVEDLQRENLRLKDNFSPWLVRVKKYQDQVHELQRTYQEAIQKHIRSLSEAAQVKAEPDDDASAIPSADAPQSLLPVTSTSAALGCSAKSSSAPAAPTPLAPAPAVPVPPPPPPSKAYRPAPPSTPPPQKLLRAHVAGAQ